MTSRIVEVVSCDDCGQGWQDDIDEHGHSVFDTTPDHRVYRVVGVNCTTDEFAQWFCIVDTDNEYVIGGRACEEYIDLGGAVMPMRIGMRLEITFEQYFNAWLERRIMHANYQLNALIDDTIERLDLSADTR
ncbi:hypothetical protein J4N45_10030 [Vibrio sp. SCSIO 43140]|uniref:hypothetical protein n=1 Tax=Vibrio sp. SCSIO 43140 TaxID=2819100 RepID=UPI0020760A70|nr:hypothetical protein [Vibrio sp. SCSIO 43140]USD58867.1 hypothetical protein J4N45_10030 [Vibrio sp. SCSIO 43140]